MNTHAAKERTRTTSPKRPFFPSRVVMPVHTVKTAITTLPIQSKCACGGGCLRCQNSSLVQAKLKFGEPDDRYEQEADRVADQVMGMPDPVIQRKPG